MIFYTADLHFGHKNIIRSDQRPFFNVSDMDESLIRLWNDKVSDKDTVYIIGDFCYRNERPAEWYLKQLKGKKHLVIGNHDEPILQDKKALSYFVTVNNIVEIKDEAKRVVLCHYPLAEWDGFYRGSFHVYGHIHGNRNHTYEIMSGIEGAYNAGCMINHYAPATFDELVKNNVAFKNFI